MPRPRRVIHISLHLPHREVAIPALLLLVIAAVAVFMAFPRHHPVSPTTLDQDLALPVAEKPSNAQLADKALNARVEKLLTAMSLEQKVGQLTQYTGGEWTGPEGNPLDYDAMIERGEIGSLFNVVGAYSTNRYQHLAVEKSPLHIPLLFGYDVIHGEHTIFPVPLALASSFDPDLVRQLAHMAAQEAADDGVRWVFSPMVDIARDARWGRITEGAGEDTFLGSVMARAYVEGYQGDDLSQPDAVAACVKHFAAYGAANAGREYNTVDMSELSLRQVYLPPYHAGIAAGAATVMSAFNPLNGVPATANPFTLTEILRHEWKFDGMVVSDYGAIRELINHGIASNENVAARKALLAGVDMDMESDLYRTRLADLVQSGRIPQAALDEAVRRVLRVKFALGLFDHPYTVEKKGTPVITPEKRALVRKAAEETLVLLKNNVEAPDTAPVLPLAKNAPSIALIGPLADSPLDMLGSWPAEGRMSDVVTLRAALQDRFKDGKTKVLYAKGTSVLSDSDAGFAEAVAAARQASVVILALGESAATMTGESSSLTRLDLPGNQEELLETITALGKPTVLVLFDGRPLALKWAAAHVPAILEAWYPGIEAGPAVTDILFGDANPSGKLPVTFPRAVGQEPLYYNQLPTGRPADQIDLTLPPTTATKYFSRYIDETNAPLFPFGFGLSYTQFAYSNLKLDPSTISLTTLQSGKGGLFATAPAVRVRVDVKNTGSVPGVEIAQLYLRNTGGSMEEPVRELKGFQRVSLKPGESKQIEFTLGFGELSYYNFDLKRVIEPTEYHVWVGGSSGAALDSQFEVTP
ncbi:MAG TPA: glycoside hydrolase family 3 N-terminal domain-containing protein [Candidatus Methylacidiphilales bacterium]|jgi:beta-glucosidase|nr:glycoside hydrolase family 3 N-terminal domain-containing protein [Candidatus Methylacidiphilales bacterium]